MRLLLIFGLVLALVGMGPVPLSACAFITSQMAECKTPETQTTCDKMGMAEDGPQLAASSNGSCCFLSKAPSPEVRQKVTDYFQATTISHLERGVDDSLPQLLAPVFVGQDFSPPSVNSLLCTFLI